VFGNVTAQASELTHVALPALRLCVNLLKLEALSLPSLRTTEDVTLDSNYALRSLDLGLVQAANLIVRMNPRLLVLSLPLESARGGLMVDVAEVNLSSSWEASYWSRSRRRALAAFQT